MEKLKSPADDYAFLLTRAAQQSLWDDPIPGAVEAAAGAILAASESLLQLGPEVLDAALAGTEFGVRLERLARELERDVRSDPMNGESPSAARAVCAYLHARGEATPADLLEVSLRETKERIESSHWLARIRDRELMLCRLRREIRRRPGEMTRLVETAIAKQ